MNIQTKLIETPREFTVFKQDTPLQLPVRRLTVRQLHKAGETMAEKIRSDRRQEHLKIAAGLEPGDRMRFLVAAARDNVAVEPGDVEKLSDTAFGVKTILLLATDLSDAELEPLFQEPANAEELEYARYFAIGMDVDALRTAVEAGRKEEGAPPDAGAMFPETGGGQTDPGPLGQTPVSGV